VREEQDRERLRRLGAKAGDDGSPAGNRFIQVRLDASRAQRLIQVPCEHHLVTRRIRRVDPDQAREVRDDLVAEAIPLGLG